MKITKIVGNTEEEVLIKIKVIHAMLLTCSIASKSTKRSALEQEYQHRLHADKDNLLAWVMKSRRIADVYYAIPEKYRK
jgi:hypothetical protein